MSNDDYEPGSIPDSESEEFTEEKEKALRELPDKSERMLEAEDLPNWVKTAITKYELGVHPTWQDAADAYEKDRSTLGDYVYTPAGRAWRQRISDLNDDPERMAEMMLRGSLHHFTADLLAMWEAAMEAGDYEWIRKAWKDITEGVAPQIAPKGGGDGGAGGSQIVINLPSGADLEDTTVEPIDADYEMVEDEDDV